ncbi:MAG: HAD family hydrolase [Proteobacteria bacterium]|nr:HAD family hydrolase [Pseudomonadota bacterium]MCP4922266.1 HAD family hydrolase [Pseudomonadota bacterium]
MRSFGQVMTPVDEPLYAFYLDRTGLEHPMREAVLASQSRDWRQVVEDLDALPGPVYEKHMAHHLLPEVGRDWLARRTNVLLIRHPAEVLASYARARPELVAEDLGFLQQAELLDTLADPIVVDSEDILRDPAAKLAELCERAGLLFDERMLSWGSGARAEDGAWAPHWYGSVHASSGFAAWKARSRDVLPRYQAVYEQLVPAYERLKEVAL